MWKTLAFLIVLIALLLLLARGLRGVAKPLASIVRADGDSEGLNRAAQSVPKTSGFEQPGWERGRLLWANSAHRRGRRVGPTAAAQRHPSYSVRRRVYSSDRVYDPPAHSQAPRLECGPWILAGIHDCGIHKRPHLACDAADCERLMEQDAPIAGKKAIRYNPTKVGFDV